MTSAARGFNFSRRSGPSRIYIKNPGPRALGIEVNNGECLHLIDISQKLPVSVSRVFTTLEENQSKIEIHVIQGAELYADKNNSLYRFMLTNINPVPAGKPKIKVTFQVNTEGLFRIIVHNLDSGEQMDTILAKDIFGKNFNIMDSSKLKKMQKKTNSLYNRVKKKVDLSFQNEILEVFNKTAECLKRMDSEKYQEVFISLDIIYKELKLLKDI